MLADTVAVAEARAAGITWDVLQSLPWQRVACGVYARSAVNADPLLRLAAAARRIPPEAVFSGRTAGWLHGLDLSPCDPIEVTVPAGHRVAHRAGMRFRKCRLDESELTSKHGMRVTAVTRTLADIGSERDINDAVIALDMALHKGLVSKAGLMLLPGRYARRKGVARLRQAVDLAVGAESPMETRLRLLLVRAGLPRPEPQVNLFDGAGRLVARADLYYSSRRLCIEFDGGYHRDALVEDNRRQNQLVEAGFRVLRFTSSDVMGNPAHVVAIVRDALSRPDAPDFSRNLARKARRTPDFWRNQAGGGTS